MDTLSNRSSINDKRFLFWQQWLFYTSLFFALFGIVFALYGNNPLFRPYTKMLAHVFWNSEVFPAKPEQFRAFIFGPLGGTIACCYILLAFIARYPFKARQRWARNAVAIAFMVWILPDSLICLYYRVYPQIYIINAFSFIIKALPLFFTWKDFR